MEIFFKIYEGLSREGPGSLHSAERALRLCKGLPERPDILEPGCGSGGATLNLARLTRGTITATDVYQPFLDVLAARARKAGVADRVRPRGMDMAALDFAPGSFDLIWCEGAAYIMGVDNALAAWRPLLRPGGYLVFSDAVWTTDDVPDELRTFWAEAYPAMRTAEANAAAAEAAGYTPLGHFLIESACWEDFYDEVERRITDVEPEFGRDPDGRAILDATRREIDLYRRYPDRYGYSLHALRRD
ncbi:MAG: class I SAM-dependent methyltransferase [Pseudodesulfovibrio sp.]